MLKAITTRHSDVVAIVHRHGLPVSVSTHAANHHEVTLVQLSFDFYMIEAKPENLIGDKAYDFFHGSSGLTGAVAFGVSLEQATDSRDCAK